LRDFLAMMGKARNHYLLSKAMELRHLRYFIAVAEEGHLTRAAERLGIQPPPLSRQIRDIEREIDVRLFHRKPRGLELTDAGYALLDDARAMLAQLDRALDTARRTARGEQGRISVGYTSGAGLHPLVQRAIREFREAFPLVAMTLEEDFPYDLSERLRNDQIDVAFIRTPVTNLEGIAIDLLQEEAIVAALPRSHALARSGTALPLKALAGETFVIYGRPQGTLTLQGNAIMAGCEAAGFTPRVGYIAPHHLSTLNLVAAGLGVSLVSASVQRMNIEGVIFRRLTGAGQIKVPLNIATRHGDPSAVVRQFLKMAKRAARNFRTEEGKA
jgi:DNA-binding transcriptional LysR family regulator